MRARWLMVSASVFVALPALAEAPRFYNLESFGEFLDGNPETTAVTEDGSIVLPPIVRDRHVDPSAAYSAATARGDDVIVARVDDGTVMAVDRAGKTRTLFESEETLVTALLATSRGLFVATSVPAKIYRVDSGGKSKLFHSPDAGFIWEMVAGPNDTMLAVTGEPGTVLRIDSKGNSKTIFEPDQEHLRSIVYDKALGIFVGGGERGVLYRSSNGKDFRALYDTGHPEVTAVAVLGNYAYAAGVTGAEALASVPSDPKAAKGKPPVEVRSQLVQVAMDGAAEVIAGSSDEAIFAMAVDDKGRIVVATGGTGRDDPRGRLYAIDGKERLISMLYQSPSRRITHLVAMPRAAMVAVAADGGRLTNITGGYAREGEFLTLPFDTGINSQFGVVTVFGSWPKGTSATVAARSGQTAEPDDSWAAWSKPIRAPGGTRPQIPNGRYLQLRIRLGSKGAVTPEVQRVRLAYLRQNLPPFVREVVTLEKGFALIPLPHDEPKTKTISLDGQASPVLPGTDDQKPRARPRRAKQVERRGALTVKWLAEDPNGDKLRYDLSYRSMGRRSWRKMEEKLKEPFYTINSAQLPDGHYQFRVRATDAPSNPDGLELDDSRDSRSILIDNTAPTVDPLDVRVTGRRVSVRIVVADAVGPLVRAEFSLDGGEFRPMIPDDGVLDGSGESFGVRLGELSPGDHTFTARFSDEALNEGFAEAAFQVR